MEKFLLKKVVVLLSLSFLFISPNFLLAQESEEITIIDPAPHTISINLKIIAEEDLLYDNLISVLACDSDNDTETEDSITAYCAILQSGLLSTWDWSWAPSAFLSSISDITGYTSLDDDGNAVYHYWSWSVNDQEGMSALNQYELQPDDLLLIEFISPEEEVVEEEDDDGGNNSGGGGNNVTISPFSLYKVFSFLDSSQTSNGFFINDMYSDWLAIALAKTTGETDALKDKVYQNLLYRNFDSIMMTDILRHSMALMAFDINPYNDKEINYIEKIISSFDGTQLGDSDLYNDDIFALIVLYHVGFKEDDEIIKKVSSHIISKQSNNGSWGGVDMTSAAIQALRNFNNLNGALEAISKAEFFLVGKQEGDGSFDNNIFSTSWAIQALLDNNSFSNQVDKAILYLEGQQKEDGGFMLESTSLENRLWATSYALPAILRLSWSDILFFFDKIEEIEINYNNDDNKLAEVKPEDLSIEIEIEEIKLNETEEVKKEDLVVVFKKDFINLEEEANDKNEINSQNLVASALDLSKEDNNNFIFDIYSFLAKILSNFWIKLISLF